MARNVIVKFNGTDDEHKALHRDLTVGKTYIALILDGRMTGNSGNEVWVDDELRIPFDDVLDNVVTRMSFGFEIVAEA